VSLNKSETWKWKNLDISWSLSKESTSEKNIKIEISFCKKNITYFLPNNFSISRIFNFIKVGRP